MNNSFLLVNKTLYAIVFCTMIKSTKISGNKQKLFLYYLFFVQAIYSELSPVTKIYYTIESNNTILHDSRLQEFKSGLLRVKHETQN